MLKEAIEKIESMAKPTTGEINGHWYSILPRWNLQRDHP